MDRVIVSPPAVPPFADGAVAGGWWRELDDARILCELCPRACVLKEGDRGFCFVRENRQGQMALTTYGRSTGFCVDPIEKKPLNHFYPGTSVLSFGTAGCNLGCKFCQNWDISKSREVARLSQQAGPEEIAAAAVALHCRSVAFTYNDPVIWAEYAIDVAAACRERDVKTVAVTAGYITPQARPAFFAAVDAANVDLKAFSEQFYQQLTASHLQPVLETLTWLREETEVWLELTNLIIPDANDGGDELQRMCGWILAHLGPDIPVHFTAFHPDFRLRDRPATPHETLLDAYALARREGLRHVYVGNVHDKQHQSTYCWQCQGLLIERDWHALGEYRLRVRDAEPQGAQCGACGAAIAGRFAARPGTWGRRRLPVDMNRFRMQSAAQARPVAEPPAEPAEPPAEPAGLAAESPGASRVPPPAAPTVNPLGEPMSTASDLQSPADLNQLSEAQLAALHGAVCRVLAGTVQGRGTELASLLADRGLAELVVMGAFVTVKRSGWLRGCCGVLGKPLRLGDALQQAAGRTATDDQRFPPLTLGELPYLQVSLSLLHSFRPVPPGAARREAVEVGTHGLQIRRDGRAGLLLPSVAVEHGLNRDEFLRQVCLKAQLPPTAWQDPASELLTFRARGFSAPYAGTGAPPDGPGASPVGSAAVAGPLPRESLEQLRQHVRQNVVAAVRGATPLYYLPGGFDGTVQGVGVSVHFPRRGQTACWLRLSLRPGVPLQATLAELAQQVAASLAPTHAVAEIAEATVDLAVFDDAALHGTVAEPDLRGVAPGERALLISGRDRQALGYHPQLAAGAELLARVAAACEPAPQSTVVSLRTAATGSEFTFRQVPQATPGPAVRQPAVAGQFYPADPSQLAGLVDDVFAAAGRLASHPQGQPRDPSGPGPEEPAEGSLDAAAILLPHAGLIYSGAVAAAVLQRVRFPATALVIGPKHTRLGVNWSAAPFDAWKFPGGQVAGAAELTRRLVEAIDGLELDAVAHQREHCIEVELPLLARVAPGMAIAGLVVGEADWPACRRFAEQLARFLRELPEPPLLIISSDMNHFADDRHTRALDEVALQAIETGEAARVYQTITANRISMCGVRPAVIVMETLRQLGALAPVQRIAYATSGDVSGDRERVVGYAGLLWPKSDRPCCGI